jgi:hypothetical protein
MEMFWKTLSQKISKFFEGISPSLEEKRTELFLQNEVLARDEKTGESEEIITISENISNETESNTQPQDEEIKYDFLTIEYDIEKEIQQKRQNLLIKSIKLLKNKNVPQSELKELQNEIKKIIKEETNWINLKSEKIAIEIEEKIEDTNLLAIIDQIEETKLNIIRLNKLVFLSQIRDKNELKNIKKLLKNELEVELTTKNDVITAQESRIKQLKKELREDFSLNEEQTTIKLTKELESCKNFRKEELQQREQLNIEYKTRLNLLNKTPNKKEKEEEELNKDLIIQKENLKKLEIKFTQSDTELKKIQQKEKKGLLLLYKVLGLTNSKLKEYNEACAPFYQAYKIADEIGEDEKIKEATRRALKSSLEKAIAKNPKYKSFVRREILNRYKKIEQKRKEEKHRRTMSV